MLISLNFMILVRICRDLVSRKETFLKKDKILSRVIPDIPGLAVTFYSGTFRGRIIQPPPLCMVQHYILLHHGALGTDGSCLQFYRLI